MKKFTLIALLLVCSVGFATAQDDSRYDKEKLETARIAFITSRLNLTSEQAQKFWPIYNKYSEVKQHKLRELSHLNRGNSQELSEIEAKNRIQQGFDLQRKIIAEEEKFVNEIAGIIDYNQILKLNGLSREFARHVYQRRRRPD